MTDNIRFVLDKSFERENSRVNKSTKSSAIINDGRKRNFDNKKSFKNALKNVRKIKKENEINDTELHDDDVIVSSSLSFLIRQNSKIGRIVGERIASSPRINSVLNEKLEESSEPLESKKRG